MKPSLLTLLCSLLSLLPALAIDEGVREQWGELTLILKEPVVARSVVDNATRRAELERHEAVALSTETHDSLAPLPSDEDCGLNLFTVSGEPAPRLRWKDQNKLAIEFAPGTSPNTEYRLSFKPGVGYLGGTALQTGSFTFHSKPANLRAQYLPEYAGGAALLTATHCDSAEAQQLAARHDGLRVTFRRMRHVPLVGWVCTATTPATLEPATVASGLSLHTREEVLQNLLQHHKPEDIRPDTVLPQCLLARPQRPLAAGARYELSVEAAPGCGFESGTLSLGETPESLAPTLESELVAPEQGRAATTRLTLRFATPVPEAQLHALWEQLSVSASNGEGSSTSATRQADGRYTINGEATGGEVVSLRLARLLPCESDNTATRRWRQRHEHAYRYAPPGCAMGMEVEVQSPRPLALEFTLPPIVCTRHGLRLWTSPLVLRASSLPACPVLTGNGCNDVPLSGSHQLRLPCINVASARATAYHWEPEAAARLLPIIQRGMRDDTVDGDLRLAMECLRRRAAEGEHTEGYDEDLRTEAGRALHLLRDEYDWKASLRERALAEASVYPTVELSLSAQGSPDGLLQRGEAQLDLDQLTCGTLRPGLYLISLTTTAHENVQRARALYRHEKAGDITPGSCTVDYLVLVSDISARVVGNRLLAASLATGEPLEGVEVCAYGLPVVRSRRVEDEPHDADAYREATPLGRETSDQPGQGDTSPMAMQQGALALPRAWEEGLLLLRRGEDYSLLSLANHDISYRNEADTTCRPMVEIFHDRPLYRPGDVVHLRGVLRAGRKGGLSLPQAREAELSFCKPNGEAMEQRTVALDAFGAFATDFQLPEGEEDVTGSYSCRFCVKEAGQTLERTIYLRSEVFRRDAFRVELSAELDPVAPRACRIKVQARDYNGTPVVNGKLTLKLRSDAPLLDEAGQPLEGVEATGTTCTLRRELPLDAEGCAHWQSALGALDEQGMLHVEASVANDREEHVRADHLSKTLSPADFFIEFDEKNIIRLRDARTREPLARAQELQLRLTTREDKRLELPCGLYQVEQAPRELHQRRLTVPAQGRLDLEQELADLREELSSRRAISLELSGQDAAGNRIRATRSFFSLSRDAYAPDAVNFGTLTARGREVTLSANTPLVQAGKLHVLIHSQGRLRHTLAQVPAGAESLTIPLAAQEYGEVAVTAVLCGKDAHGGYRHWSTLAGSCTLPRPDKQLSIELTLPEGAKPGERVSIRGRVTDAEGKPARACVTLFAVDAGMMNLAPYTLPDLAATFYQGHARTLCLSGPISSLSPVRPSGIAMPDIWGATDRFWQQGRQNAQKRSVYPQQVYTEALERGLGSLCHLTMGEVIRCAQPDFRLRDFFVSDTFYQAEPAPAPIVCCVDEEDEADGINNLRSGGGRLAKKSRAYSATMDVAEDQLPPWSLEEEGDLEPDAGGAVFVSYVPPMADDAPQPRLRRNFAPVAIWQAALCTAEDGSFATELTLPDTLTTYQTYALALDASGECFGQGQGSFLVNQQLMLTAGTPFFMSAGDQLILPLTITNNSDKPGRWEIRLSGAGDGCPRQVELDAHRSTTLSFEVKPPQEGTCTLQWTARSADGADAVEGSFPVRYPAPLLKETHRLVLGAEEEATAGLLAPEIAQATRGELRLAYSTSPLIHLAGSLDFLLSYPYGCTEQRASALLPWLFYEQLAPFCPQMAGTSAANARRTVERSITQILERQQEDGGLSYWKTSKGESAESSPWASAYAALVLTIAQEQGFDVNADALSKLRNYLAWRNWLKDDYLTQYAVARARGRESDVNRILVKALRRELTEAEEWGFRKQTADLEFMGELRSNPANRHQALLSWLRVKGKDYRHRTSWSGGWTIIALSEYLRLEPKTSGSASICINGETHPAEARPGSTLYRLAAGQRMGDIAPTLAAASGTVYASVSIKAQPEQTQYPGVTEKGLQVTRVYEKQDPDGTWREASHFRVGDLVRITLTCAKIADELEYFVLEDYLPACMEAINPNIPSQAAGLDDGGWGHWSPWFDHKEYLADRVRGFCTRWASRDIVNMSYYARVKRAGECTAPPAEAQLMYEPQTYGLSPNTRVRSE